MKKHTVARTGGFLAAVGVTAGLVAAGVNMTGAYFQDTEQGAVRVATGEVDLSVDESTPLSAPFGPLLPGGSDSNSYTLTNTGTGPVDFHLGSINWDAFSQRVITLELPASDPDGVSHEFTSGTVLEDGDSISFEYRLGDGQTCAGGVPRVFIQGGAYNTFDVDPAGPLACGVDPEGDGWFTVTQTLSGITAGPAGLVGLVNDQIANPGTIEYRALTLNGEDQLGGTPFDQCADSQMLVRVIGPAADTGNLDLCNLPAALPAFATNVSPGDSRSIQVILTLQTTAENEWANKVGTANLLAIATQAGQGVDTSQVLDDQDNPADDDA